MGRRKQRTFEALEGRDLMSITPMLGLLSPPFVRSAALASVAVPPVTSFDGGSGITSDMAAPRPSEVARRTFKAAFAGRVVESPPRLVDQARQFSIVAGGNTNQFLHGTLQLRYYTPQPGSGAITTTGSFAILDRSTASNGVLLANLTGDPTQVDARGRPTQFDFIVNGGGGSGGIYASSVGNGVLKIKYVGNRAKVSVVGSVFTLGVGQNLNVFQHNN